MDLINVRKLLIKLILFSFDFSFSPTMQYLANFSIKKEKKEEEKGEKGEKGEKEEEKKEKEKNYAPLHNSFLRNLTAYPSIELDWIENHKFIQCTMSKLWKQGLKWSSLTNYFSTDFKRK